jgi:hypothetical protein
MGMVDNKSKYRFDDRRCFNIGPPKVLPERRVSRRRECDNFRVWLKAVLTMHCEETVSDEDVCHVLAPVLVRIQTGEFG